MQFCPSRVPPAVFVSDGGNKTRTPYLDAEDGRNQQTAVLV